MKSFVWMYAWNRRSAHAAVRAPRENRTYAANLYWRETACGQLLRSSRWVPYNPEKVNRCAACLRALDETSPRQLAKIPKPLTELDVARRLAYLATTFTNLTMEEHWETLDATRQKRWRRWGRKFLNKEHG